MRIIQKFWHRLKSTAKKGNPDFAVQEGHGLWVFIQCDKCGEKIKLRIRKTDEIQRSQDDNNYAFFVRKLVMGSKCFNRMETRIEFDGKYRVIRSDVSDGQLITKSEFSS